MVNEMWLKRALSLSSLVLLVVVAAALFRGSSEEWRRYQSEYFRLAADRAATPAAKSALRAMRPEIRQDVVRGFGEKPRLDRCRTCHIAIDDPAFADGKNPLRAHPRLPGGHPFGEFGCTLCHEGDGRGLSVRHAHGEDPHWPEPLLKGALLESGCAKCHREPFPPQTPHLRRGSELFASYACEGCHTISGQSRGRLGPELTDVGRRWDVAYLAESIETPTANDPMSVMPLFPMPKEDVADLVVYLKSRRGRYLDESPVDRFARSRRWRDAARRTVPVTVASGKEVVARYRCVACHQLGAADGKLAPDLTYRGQFRDAAYIRAHLGDPRAQTPGSNMPSFWLSESEQDAAAMYLASLRGYQSPSSPREQYAALCARCHGEKGDGAGLIGGNLLPRPRQFTNDRFFNWLPDSRAHDSILNGVPGTSMPPFRQLLDERQTRALFAWIRAEFIKTQAKPGSHPPTPVPARAAPFSAESVARGKDIFEKRCDGCHGRFGDGKGPNAVHMLPRPRDLTSTLFFAKVPDARLYASISEGVPGTGMPPWDYLSETQRWDLIDYIRSLSKTQLKAQGDKK